MSSETCIYALDAKLAIPDFTFPRNRSDLSRNRSIDVGVKRDPSTTEIYLSLRTNTGIQMKQKQLTKTFYDDFNLKKPVFPGLYKNISAVLQFSMFESQPTFNVLCVGSLIIIANMRRSSDLALCWPTVCDTSPTLNQYRGNTSCSLEWYSKFGTRTQVNTTRP